MRAPGEAQVSLDVRQSLIRSDMKASGRPAKTVLMVLSVVMLAAKVSGEPDETKSLEATKVAETFEILDTLGLRELVGPLGAALKDSLSPTDLPQRHEGIRKLFPNAANELIGLQNRDDFSRIQAAVKNIDEVALVGVDWLSPRACGFTYLVVGTDGPIAFEIQFYLLSKALEEVEINAIKIYSTWEGIRDILAVQLKLPSAITVTGSLENFGEQDAEDQLPARGESEGP